MCSTDSADKTAEAISFTQLTWDNSTRLKVTVLLNYWQLTSMIVVKNRFFRILTHFLIKISTKGFRL